MRAEEFLTEGLNYPIIVVDVQPEYSGINDGDENPVFAEIIQFVNNQTGPVLMFVNAEDQGLSGDTVQDIQQYWNDTVCPEEERYSYDEETDEYIENTDCPSINWNRFSIVDKGYGYLRGWMDTGVPDSTIIKVIREMYQQKVSDSRMLFGGEESENYAEEMEKLIGSDVEHALNGDAISVGWASVAQLRKFNGAYIVGGGRHECLREVELLMNAFNIKYKRIDTLVYG